MQMCIGQLLGMHEPSTVVSYLTREFLHMCP